jgi:alpha-aminoadipic semialdehyde synthase
MIGIRHEDKSKWETRVPLAPEDVRRLIDGHRLRFHVQTSPTRVFPDEEYRAAGAAVTDHLRDCPIILGVKEIPVDWFEPEKTYVFFSHVIKRQPRNMPMLRRMVELGCTLIDYECIVDERGRRLVFFGRYAGLAGMIDTLWALGQRLRHEGIDNPFAEVRQTYQYDNLEQAKRGIAKVGERIRQDGLPAEIQPLICGFAGYGNVSLGAQEVYDLLPVQEISPDDAAKVQAAPRECYKVVYHEKHLVERVADAGFELQEYYDHPELYHTKFFPQVHTLTLLVNCIYWDPRYPRLVTCDQLRDLFSGRERPRLRVIGDITCDIEGSIECNLRPTEPDDPVYVYEPHNSQVRSGVAGDGPVILAIDHLPCELPADASKYFGQSLAPLIPGLARADFKGSLEQSGLDPELQRATILYKGELTQPYRYLEPEIR